MAITDFASGLGNGIGNIIHWLMFWERWDTLSKVVLFGLVGIFIIIWALFKYEVNTGSQLPNIYNLSRKRKF